KARWDFQKSWQAAVARVTQDLFQDDQAEGEYCRPDEEFRESGVGAQLDCRGFELIDLVIDAFKIATFVRTEKASACEFGDFYEFRFVVVRRHGAAAGDGLSCGIANNGAVPLSPGCLDPTFFSGRNGINFYADCFCGLGGYDRAQARIAFAIGKE